MCQTLAKWRKYEGEKQSNGEALDSHGFYKSLIKFGQGKIQGKVIISHVLPLLFSNLPLGELVSNSERREQTKRARQIREF